MRLAASVLLSIAITVLGLGLILAVIELGAPLLRGGLVAAGVAGTLAGFFWARSMRTEPSSEEASAEHVPPEHVS